MTKSILVVAAHPDDEWFGIGGTLLRYHKIARYKINILIVTDGERGDGRGPERLKTSEDLCMLEFDTHLKPLRIPANYVDKSYSEAVKKLDVIIHQLQPSIILTHYSNDTHQDHRAVFNIVQSAARNAPDSSVWLFESPSTVNFIPNNIVCIDDFFLEKITLYRKYFSKEIEGRNKLSIDYMETMNSYWGAKIMRDYAEAYRILKAVVL